MSFLGICIFWFFWDRGFDFCVGIVDYMDSKKSMIHPKDYIIFQIPWLDFKSNYKNLNY